jgi:hypothetical protein
MPYSLEDEADETPDESPALPDALTPKQRAELRKKRKAQERKRKRRKK